MTGGLALTHSAGHNGNERRRSAKNHKTTAGGNPHRDRRKRVLTELEVPCYVTSHIDSTRALDGQQTDEWDGISARWTFHPESGLHLVLRDG